jgi:predicted Ser/Thr protein kinase
VSEISEGLRAALAARYDLRRELGRGGMATVYLAADVKHHREVAIKVLRADLAASLGAERFLKEIEIAARLTHPHILALHDSGEAGGFLYYVMPYIEGGSLRQVLEAERRLSVDRALEIAEPVADALGYAHRMGVLHRDIKPENILFSQGHPIVADFGIAKAISTAGVANLTRTGFPLGTPGYMSPEQAAGLTDLDVRTDVYSLAAVVYEMLVGQTPGHWPSDEAVRTGRLLEAPPTHRAALGELPGHIEAALAHAFAVRSAQRTASPSALMDELRGAVVSAAPVPVDAPAGGVLMAAPHRRFSEGEVQEIVRRAAELEVSNPTASGALTIGGIQQVAAEALIPAERVREAAFAVEARRAPPVVAMPDGTPDTRGQRAARFWLGAPTYLLFERVVTGELPDVEFSALVEMMRAELGQVGQGGQLGRSFSWTTVRSASGGGRDVQILVSVRGGATRIAVRENLGGSIGAIYGGVGGGVGGGGFGVVMGVLAGALHTPAAAIVAVPLWLATVFSGARSIYYYVIKARRAQLERLTDQLAALAAQLVRLR